VFSKNTQKATFSCDQVKVGQKVDVFLEITWSRGLARTEQNELTFPKKWPKSVKKHARWPLVER
jgi:hypothetical protein